MLSKGNMKSPHAFLLALAVSLATASAAHAQDAQTAPKLFAELGYSSVDITVNGGGNRLEASPGLVTTVFGYAPHPNFAVEAFLGFGAGKDNISSSGVATPLSVKYGTLVGVFARPRVNLTDSFELFGRAGWVHTEAKTSGPGLSVTEKDSDFAYGIGANFHITSSSYLQATWTNFYGREGTKIEGFGLSYGMRF